MESITEELKGVGNTLEGVGNTLEGIKEQLQGLIEVNARFAQEIIALKGGSQTSSGFGSTTPVASTGSAKKSNKVILTCNDDDISITGNTYDHRGIFFENGGAWNKAEKSWMVALDKKDSVVEALKAKSIEYEVC